MPAELKASKANPPSAPVPTPPERQPVNVRYLDRVDVAETFADSITSLLFDGQTLRIEFGVTRFDEMKTNSPITGRRYPACRLVLSPAIAMDLINRIQGIVSALNKTAPFNASARSGLETAKAS
jgi:hypothetical protein